NALIACLRRGIDEKVCLRLGLTKINENISSTHFASIFRQHTFYESLQDYWNRREKFNEADSEYFQKFGDVISRGSKLEMFINRSLIRDIEVFCTVTNTSLHWFKEQNLFNPDLIILDEAGQVTEPISWQILLLGKRFVIVGDHHQLDSIIFSREKGLSSNFIPCSLLERLMSDFKDKKGYIFTLNVNYRSNELIQRWSNNQFYDKMLIASDKTQKIHINQITKDDSYQIIDDPLVLLDTANIEKEELLELQLKYPFLSPISFFDSKPEISSSFYNLGEAICAAHQILSLKKSGLHSSEIGCITPYALQTEKIKKLLAANSDDSLDVSSVDAFQGQQREAIVMSFVRNNNMEHIGFLRNLRRMNVAITRAKRQFFLIASSRVLKKHEGFNDLYNLIVKEGRVIRPRDSLLDNSINLKIPKSIIEDTEGKTVESNISQTQLTDFVLVHIFKYSSNTSSLFDKAVSDLKNLSKEPNDETKLELYGLFKQASTGDVKGEKPGMLDFVGRAKYDSWNKNKGLSMEEAKLKYIEIINKLIEQTSSVDQASNVEALIDAFSNSNKCNETSITVLTGIGNYYCAGNDLSNFTRNVKTPNDLIKMADKGEDVLERFVRAHIEHEKPLISLVNGPAIGISVTLMALFDLVIASDKASFHSPFSSLGQSPEGCSSYTFPMLMGATKACEMLLFDKKLTAAEAYERNLVTRIIPHNSFYEETERLVSRLSELPPESLKVNKQLLRNVHKDALLSVCKHECAVLKQRWLSVECQQALQKFASRKT
uniref:ACB domain-containing protein n=1 Tax=Meloidogyne floridensis TaxID=298350 RepID=A0A915NI35_9BILA